MRTALVTGAGGFLGYHLVRALRDQGLWVRGADVTMPQFGASSANQFIISDLRDFNNCMKVTRGIDHVYHLAAEVGGLGFIHDGNHAQIARSNTLMNLHMLEAARMQGVDRFLFASSAVVYPMYLQQQPDVTALNEDTVMPADPAEGGYGWDKLYTEQVCRWYREGYGLDTRIARLHNSYGPYGTWRGGREKAPAAICRKVAMAANGDAIEVWGTGEQTRSFTYVADTVEGLSRLMQSDCAEPVNIGSSELVTINQLVDLVADIAGKTIHKHYLLDKPEGVRGRNSDNTLCRAVLDWEPETPLRTGLSSTYAWIADQVSRRGRNAA